MEIILLLIPFVIISIISGYEIRRATSMAKKYEQEEILRAHEADMIILRLQGRQPLVILQPYLTVK